MAVAVRSLRSVPKQFSLLPSPSELHASFVLSFLPLPFRDSRFQYPRKSPSLIHAKKRSSQLEPVQKISSTQGDVEEEDISTQEDGEDFEDGTFVEDDFEAGIDDVFEDDFEDEFEDVFEEEEEEEEEDLKFFVGDGSGGGRISLAGTWWDKKALAIAEEVSQSLDGDFRIYSFKTSNAATIHMRIEKLSNKYGSPTLNDIEVFSTVYQARLGEAEVAGAIPENISLEVSSPGLERLVRVPHDLDRFKDLPMYVRYATDMAATGPPKENDGVFKLVSFDLELGCCTWGIADVRINREQKGKGRPLSKKQREWRLQLPFESLRLVRLHSEF